MLCVMFVKMKIFNFNKLVTFSFKISLLKLTTVILVITYITISTFIIYVHKISRMLEVEHPAAKVLVELAHLQDEEVGDGTTTVVIIAAELLKVCSLSILMFLSSTKFTSSSFIVRKGWEVH